jgi:hypothetical protein
MAPCLIYARNACYEKGRGRLGGAPLFAVAATNIIVGVRSSLAAEFTI